MQNIEEYRRKLIFRAWHRGTREMDLLLGSFADRNVPNFDERQLKIFENLLIENDPDVYDWIIGRTPLPVELKSDVSDLLLLHKFAK